MLAWTIYISFFGVVISTLLPRDNALAARVVALLTALGGLAIALAGAFNGGAGMTTPVSYTHLTLPTILRV